MMTFNLEKKNVLSQLIACSLLVSTATLSGCAAQSMSAKSEAEIASGSETDADALIKEAEADTTEDEVNEYTVTDYQGFNPNGIVVHFEFKKADLSPKNVAALDKIVAGMTKDELATITIRGHADKQGEKDYNEKLSEKRAKVIRDYLLNHGIESDRLNPVHLGSAEPVDDKSRVSAYKKNRRGDFNISYAPSAFGPSK